MDNFKESIHFPDYFLIKEDVICHTLSEYCEDQWSIIWFPKYFPILSWEHVENFKIMNWKKYYNHLESFYHSLDMMRKLYPSYLKYVPHFGEELCVFSLQSDIQKIYDPKKTAEVIYNNSFEEQIYKDTKLLMSILITDLWIDVGDIGIEWSIMLWGFQESSDIDMIIYWHSATERLKQWFEKLKRHPEIHLYNEDDTALIFSRRWKYRSFLSNEELLLQEKRRSVWLIHWRRFRAQPVLWDRSIENTFQERHLVSIDIIEDEFEVVDSDNGYLRPAFYKIYNANVWEVNLECYDPIYMNQCSTWDKVLVRWKIYKDIVNNQKTIILWPWIFTHQYLRNTLFIQ